MPLIEIRYDCRKFKAQCKPGNDCDNRWREQFAQGLYADITNNEGYPRTQRNNLCPKIDLIRKITRFAAPCQHMGRNKPSQYSKCDTKAEALQWINFYHYSTRPTFSVELINFRFFKTGGVIFVMEISVSFVQGFIVGLVLGVITTIVEIHLLGGRIVDKNRVNKGKK